MKITCEKFIELLKNGAIDGACVYELPEGESLRISDGCAEALLDGKGAVLCVDPKNDEAAVIIDAADVALKGLELRVSGGVGIRVCAHDVTVIDCSAVGAAMVAEFDRSEHSAAEGEGYNLLFTGCRADKIEISGVANGVLLFNKVGQISVRGCTYAYVIENEADELCFSENRYLIADGNSCGNISAKGNSEVNGNDLTDVNARAELGANRDIVPHIDPEQFVGMARKNRVILTDGKNIGEYIAERLSVSDTVIVPPGAYLNTGMTFENINDKKIYAYGVLLEMPRSTAHHMYFKDCERITVKGVFMGHAVYPHTQGTVCDITGTAPSHADNLSFIPDPGYLADFSNGADFGAFAAGRIFGEGMPYSYSCVDYQSKSYDREKNENTICNVLVKGPIAVGQRIAFRNNFGGMGLCMHYCSEMKVEDVTVFSASGFAESDGHNKIAPVLHRYAVVRGPAPVLDKSKEYDDRNGVLWTDAYGRLRSATPTNTTADATHSSAARKGIQIISCLFEFMEDDAGNINSYYGLGTSFDKERRTLSYTTCDVNGYKLLPPPFKSGDTVMLYTMRGKFVARTVALSDTAEIGDKLYEVMIGEDIEWQSDDALVVQNASASGDGFLVDNVVQNNSKWCCFRVQADCEKSGGVIKNSSFSGVCSIGLSLVPQYTMWPEVGYARNVSVRNNIFAEISSHSAPWEHWEYNAIHIPAVFGGGMATPDPDYCIHKDIEFVGNLYDKCHSRYAIRILCVDGLRIVGNRFTDRYGHSGDTQAPLLIWGGRNILIEDNVFPDGVESGVELRPNPDGEVAFGVYGNNV